MIKKTSRIFFFTIGISIFLISCQKPEEKIKINPYVKPGIPVMDYDSNVYNTIQIGQQIWMQENLRTTHFNNGFPIIGFKIYDFDTTAVEDYGLLYTWLNAVDTCGICPPGMHIPSQHEVAVLVEYLGGVKLAGGYLKERGLNFWDGPNNGANNESKWSGRGAGYYSAVSYLYINRKKIGYWWTRTTNYPQKGFVFTLDKMTMDVDYVNYPINFGFSIRCLHDSLDLTVPM